MTAPTVEQLGTARERVEAGFDWLSLTRPGWWATTDLTRLNVGSWYWCPAGQALGRYHAAQITTDEAIVMGFDSPLAAEAYDGDDLAGWQRQMDDDYRELTDVWRELIVARRAALSEAA